MSVAPKKVQNGTRKCPQVMPAKSKSGLGMEAQARMLKKPTRWISEWTPNLAWSKSDNDDEDLSFSLNMQMNVKKPNLALKTFNKRKREALARLLMIIMHDVHSNNLQRRTYPILSMYQTEILSPHLQQLFQLFKILVLDGFAGEARGSGHEIRRKFADGSTGAPHASLDAHFRHDRP